MVLKRIQEIYTHLCNDDWEHSSGITIVTLDNPGWKLEIDLCGTHLASSEFDQLRLDRSTEDWIYCWKTPEKFEAACGPNNLEEVMEVFVKWWDKEVPSL